MKTERQNEDLIKKYPKLFELVDEVDDPKMPITLFHIECDDGWYDLLDTLFACMQNEVDHNDVSPVTLTQVKEKFGSLRVYYMGGDLCGCGDRIDGMVSLAEALSARICEVCGAPGKIDPEAGWLRCRCKKHHMKD